MNTAINFTKRNIGHVLFLTCCVVVLYGVASEVLRWVR